MHIFPWTGPLDALEDFLILSSYRRIEEFVPKTRTEKLFIFLQSHKLNA